MSEPGERAHPLGSHRVTLVGHRRRTNLFGLERLFQFALVGQQSQVRSRNDGRSRRPRERSPAPASRPSACKSDRRPVRLRRSQTPSATMPIEGLDLGVVAVEKGQEARLSARRALDAQELELGRSAARSRPDRGPVRGTRASPACRRSQAGRAENGCNPGREDPSTAGELGEGVDRAASRSRTSPQPFAGQDQVGVIGDVATGRAEVDDRPGPGAASPKA